MKSLLIVIGFLALSLFNSISAVEFSSVEFSGKRFTVCRVDVQKEQLQLFHRDESGIPLSRFERLATWLDKRGQKLVFAMNAGMYHEDYSSVGLFVSSGHQFTPLNTDDGEGNFFLKPNGIFVLTDVGAKILETSEYSALREHVILATQSGPLLVQANKIHPAFNAQSVSRLLRNGVGVPSPDIALFVISEEPVNFYEFARLFRDQLGCRDALFFDGSVSSLYAPALQRNDFRVDLGPMIGVTK